MTIPKPASPELLDLVKGVIHDEIWNYDNPPEQSTQLEGTKEHGVWKNCKYLLDGLTVRDFQVLVDNCLDEETRDLVHAWSRIKQLRAAAHPKAKEAKE